MLLKVKEDFINKIYEGKQELINNIKLILYKKDENIFEKLDFENDNIYLDPILFAALNSKLEFEINNLLQGYLINKSKEILIKTDNNGYVYLPEIGYFITSEINTELNIICLLNNQFKIENFKKNIAFKFQKTYLIHNHFEVLIYPINFLMEHFYDEFGEIINVEIIEVTKKHIKNLNLALESIKTYSFNWYKLMKNVTRKFVIFNDASQKRNSFATQSVHGCAFFNAFQEGYNEIFFIEDIAHQCGHVIFNSYLVSKPNIFKIDSNTNIFLDREHDEFNEPRALFVLMHAMYTYESIFTCFNDCLIQNAYDGDKKHEILGRLSYTLMKFIRDYNLLNKYGENGENIYLTKDGEELLELFKEKFNLCVKNWGEFILNFNLENQPYNFDYTNFLILNPLEKNEIFY